MSSLRRYIRQILKESFINSISIEDVFNLIDYADSFRDLYPGYSDGFENEYEQDYYFPSKEKAYEEVGAVLSFFESLSNPIPIYRAIRVNKLDDINHDYLGDSWSYNKESALNFAKTHNGGNVLLSAEIPKEAVDWKETLRNHFLFSNDEGEYGEDEIKVNDIDALKNVKVEFIKNIVN